jgi:hypothetical protein
MLEPWAEISERLRRIHQNFKLIHYLSVRCQFDVLTVVHSKSRLPTHLSNCSPTVVNRDSSQSVAIVIRNEF